MRKLGFTLTEVLVVIFVLVSLGGLLVPAIQAARNNAKNLRQLPTAEAVGLSFQF